MLDNRTYDLPNLLQEVRLPQKRLSMIKSKTMLPFADARLNQPPIAANCALGRSTVSDDLTPAWTATLPCAVIDNQPDEQLLAAVGVPEHPPRQWRRTA